jgi:hypothetical protein
MRSSIRLGTVLLVTLVAGLGVAVRQRSAHPTAVSSSARATTTQPGVVRQSTAYSHVAPTVRRSRVPDTAALRHSTPAPVLGSWRWMGTAPAGFVRQGTQEAQVTLTLRQGQVRGFVSTGRHRYAADACYTAAQQQLQLTISTAQGSVRVQATMLKGNQRMIGTWYDAHGDDGGFVLVRINVASPHRTARK